MKVAKNVKNKLIKITFSEGAPATQVTGTGSFELSVHKKDVVLYSIVKLASYVKQTSTTT